MTLVALSCLKLHSKNFVRFYCDSCQISVQLKEWSKLVNFCVAMLILKMEEKSNILGILCFIISRKIKLKLHYTNKNLFSVWRRHYDGTQQKWFLKFHSGHLFEYIRKKQNRSTDTMQIYH